MNPLFPRLLLTQCDRKGRQTTYISEQRIATTWPATAWQMDSPPYTHLVVADIPDTCALFPLLLFRYLLPATATMTDCKTCMSRLYFYPGPV